MNTLLTMNAAAPCQELEGEPVSAMGTPSYGQRSLWFLQHLAPQGGAYNIAAAARVRSPIDAGALECAFQALVDRHAALRTTFPAIDGAPYRRVAGRQSFSLVCVDVGGWSEQALRARLAEEAWRPFDLERGPLLRATLLTGGPGGPVILLAVHHIVADFWSLAILVRELPLLYREATGAGPAQLSSAGMDYEEHVRMEREALADGRGEASLAYWRETLAGLPTLELPLDRPRPAVQTDRGDCCRLRLPGELAAALRARSRKQHATLFMTLAAAFQVLLCRHSGQEDLAIGAPRAGRSRSKLAGTVGYFVNPVVLRGDLTGDPTFAALLERTKATVLAAFEHGDYPLPLLAEHLQPVREASRTPLFQVSFVMQKETRGVEGLTAFALGEEGVLVGPEDFRLETLSLPRPPAPFELMLHAVERQGSLSLALQFNTDLFDAATAVRLLDRFALLLRSVVESPELALSALPLLSAAERHQLLHAWNDTWNDTAEAGPEATLYDLFAAQAERTPEAEAVVFDEERLTYRELAARAQALARHLVRLGVGPEVVVGVAAERSVELVAGLLGVLGAGGAYLPLEPDLPRQRLAMILEDAAPAVVLTRRAYADTLPLDAVPGLRLAWLDEVSGLPAGAAQRLPRAAADNAAYVLYTSGSTGRPKGVVNSHRGIVNRLLWMQEACGLDAGDRFLQKTPFGFDVSVPEFFAPLILGARLVVARPDGHRDSAYLARLVEQEGVTTIHFVPSMLPFFLAEDGVAARCRSLRRVLVSGEALSWEVEQRCLATLPVPLINLYGPTEAAVEVTAWECRPAERPRPGENPRPVPIGRPVRNTQIHVVGRRLEPVPPGAVGELAIGGVQVARGYRGRPDLTAERFVPDPFGPQGGRLYRTGDLCRHRPGGEIEYLGRLDDQVKIRGFRIEPREIEIALAAQPQVREAAVVVRQVMRQDGAGERSLLACVVPAAADAGVATAAELRAALAARLPPYMVPAFAFGRALDRLPNGKLDRRSLARWSPLALPGRPLEALEAPRTPLEELLAGLFAEVLGVDRLGVEESFFEHGGHSLAAMRLIARIREALGTELPLHRVFEAPTVAALARAVAGEARSDRSVAPPLVPVSRATPLPLSFAQQRLWFLHRLEPESPVYNMPAALHLPGRLDRAMLAAALGEVARRHESLRTRCIAIDGELGEPVQVVDPPAPVPVPEIDLAGLPAVRRLEEARRLAREEALRPFDLGDPEGGPLLRTALVRLGEAEQLLLLTMHHVISDGWSLRVLARELSALYDAGLERRPSPLPELAIQYGDYAVWQRGWLRGEVLEAELAHWRARLAGAPPVLDLPLDRPRPARLSSRGASRALALPPALLPLLQALARRQGVTLFMAVLAAFQALLGRISNTDDVSVGSPVAGRGQLRTEGLIGFFVNTLVLRTDLSGAPSFAELLARVRETSLAAYAHQDLPFEKLVEELHPQRDLGLAPLYQVSFVLDSEPLPALRLGDVEASLWPLETEIEKFDLSLTLGVGAEGLSGAMGFRSDLFDGTTIERLAGSFARLLAGAVAAPLLFLQQRLPELPLLSQEERQQLLRMGDGEGESYPREATLHDLFAEQAALRPDAVALAGLASLSGQGTGTALTYGELARQATRWAHRLRALGVGPEVRVALCLDRAPARVVATLAVLAAGGAYVPLDPADPRERLAFLLRSSAATVLVTEERWLPMLSELPDIKAAVLCLDGTATEEEQEEEGREATLPAVAATGLACVMYTSGSTGEPKGVAVTHRGVVRLVRGTGYARFGPDETWLLYAPYGFDASTLELWGALLHGSRLVIPPPGVLTTAELGEVVKREGVTTLWLTAGLFRQMVEENLGALSGVRQLLVGGDVLPVAHAAQVLAELPETRLINGYGPTENTCFTSCYTVRAAAELDPSVPVGRPIAHTWVAVLDRYQMPVPPGVAGELCTGGDGLARGYLDHPDRTAERFLPDPEGREAGGRLYRTGDLVRWRRSGDLEFLGRIDAQVKVRGFRVEPGEIETALMAHPRLSSAVVLAQREEAGGHRLVAYVVAAADAADPGVAPEPSELRDFLRRRLPEFMVPSAWVSLPALPLTANSKVDRKVLALLQPDRPRSTGGVPRTPAERRIAGIFAELLGVEPVGLEADFFDLGGHSLLATRLVSRVRAVFGVELPLQAVFETPTVEGLAARIVCSPSLPRYPIVPIVRMPREQPLALSFAQQRLWFLERIEPGAAYLHLPAALDCEGRLDPAALAGSLGEILRRHEGLRTRFVLSGRHPLQIPLPPAELAAVPLVPCIDLSALPATAQEGELAHRTAAEAARPFDLARGPLLHAVLLRRGPESHRLLLTVHHIAADAWSLGLLIRELGELYAACVEARPSPLPELSVHYADYAVWQRERLRGDRLEELLRYWRERLTPRPPALELPTDRPRPPVRSPRGARRPVHFDAAAVDAMRRLGGPTGATLFMAVLAVFQAVLARHAGQDDVAVGTAVADRPDPALEGVIGLFLNILVLRGDLSGDPTFRTLLLRGRERALGALAHAELPFEQLVEALQPERDLSRGPLFQVLFTLRSEPLPELALPGLALRPADTFPGAVQLDLSLLLEESRSGGIDGWIEHSSDLFDGTTVERLALHCGHLLASAAADPDRRLSDLPLLSEAERAALLVQWNDTRLEVPGPEACIHELVQAQVERTPDRIAAVDGEATLTYRELEDRASRLAHRLLRLGVRPGDRVGICVERSVSMLCSILGVLKAGAAYVPLDPAYPQARLAAMLEDSGAAALVASVASTAAGASLQHLRTLAPEALAPEVAEELPELPAAAAAYVLYTSGSTGRPKGVVVTHRNAVRLFAAMDVVFGQRGPGVWLAVTSICFDISVLELLWTLTRGFRVVIHDERPAGEGVSVAEQIARHGVSHFQCTPSMAGMLAAIPERLRSLAPLSHLLLGGEALPGPLADRLAAIVTGAVRNLYGPTETTVYSLGQRIERGEARPLIGRPLSNTEVYLLDAALQPVPLGACGEVFLGGDGVAMGYWRRPDLTAERFLPDPLGSRPGGRLYRTGDLARHRKDGSVDYLGRSDHQVKVRGVRMELGEIEEALRAHPAVAQTVAAVRDDAPGGRQLIAYLVPVAGAQAGVLVGGPSASELRRFLAERLPEAMIPSAFVPLAALPLTRNGKVDRKALPAPDTGRLRLDGAYAPPRTPDEKTLAAIWQDVLGHDRIGVDDNFFELGGSSLLLVEIEARLREAFHREIPIVEMFRHPTIRSLAEALKARGRQPATAAVVAEARPAPARVPVAVAAGEGGTLDRQRQAVEELRRRRASQQRSRGR
ncbi:MAG TPA: amino acid adenylation domain-containing protein [Thermoanaerobaculia bacterium]|jgi:amino acid adenylation domain-containing protein|nr:amino acid adenylation domain-containing protein [Thermoanaerobaculia bacterium]